jgi:hypothetical protein
MSSFRDEARGRLASAGLACALVATSVGITAVGCDAPVETSAGDVPAPAHQPEPTDAGVDARAPDPEPPAAEQTTARARVDRFFEEDDAPRLEVLRHAEITRIERGTGGRSVAFRLTFADGSRGYFKPEQTFSGTSFEAEVAAYHVDRLLDLGRVPPTVARALPWGRLDAVLAGDPRGAELIVQPDGTVRGSLSFWVEERLVPLELGVGFERWFRVEPAPYLTPFQRARVYVAQAAGTEPIVPPVGEDGAPLPLAGEPDRPDRGAELSDLVLFDYLIHNIDRWGGGFTNVRTRERGGPLVFLDQAGGFGPGRARIGFMDRRLHAVQRFRFLTVEAIRRLDVAELRARLEGEGMGPLLDERRLAHLDERRQHLLAHVEERSTAQGEPATFPW